MSFFVNLLSNFHTMFIGYWVCNDVGTTANMNACYYHVLCFLIGFEPCLFEVPTVYFDLTFLFHWACDGHHYTRDET